MFSTEKRLTRTKKPSLLFFHRSPFLCDQGVVLPRCMPALTHITWPPPSLPPVSLSDSGWLWARSGLGFNVMGGSACCTDMVRRRCVRLDRKSGFDERPKELLRSTMRIDEVFLARARWPNCSKERCTA